MLVLLYNFKKSEKSETKIKQVIAKMILPIKNNSMNPIFVPGNKGWIIKFANKIERPYFQPQIIKDKHKNDNDRSIFKNEDPNKNGIIFEIIELISDKQSSKADRTSVKYSDLFLSICKLSP